MLATVCTAGAVSPGPSLVFILGERARNGQRSALLGAVGHGVGVGLYALAAVFGLGALALALPALSRLIEVAGGLYLCWLGWGMWPRTEASAALGKTEGPSPQGWWALRAGFLMAVLNPKVMLVFVGVFAALAPPTALPIEKLGMGLLAALIDGAWYVLVALLGGALARQLAKRPMRQGFSLLLGLFGVLVLLRALSDLLPTA